MQTKLLLALLALAALGCSAEVDLQPSAPDAPPVEPADIAPGSILWSQPFTGAVASDIASAPDGSVYVTGACGGIVRAGDFELDCGVATNAFVMRLEPSGEVAMATVLRRLNGDAFLHREACAYYPGCPSLALDPEGIPIVAGSSVNGNITSFVVALDRDGSERFELTIEEAKTSDIDVGDNGRIALIGETHAATQIGDVIINGPSHGEDASFVAILEQDGAIAHVHVMDRFAKQDTVQQHHGRTYVMGHFVFKADLGGGELGDTEQTHAFLLVLDEHGAHQQSRIIHSHRSLSLDAMTIADDRLYAAGQTGPALEAQPFLLAGRIGRINCLFGSGSR